MLGDSRPTPTGMPVGWTAITSMPVPVGPGPGHCHGHGHPAAGPAQSGPAGAGPEPEDPAMTTRRRPVTVLGGRASGSDVRLDLQAEVAASQSMTSFLYGGLRN
jgi:hypothetical protein